MVKTASLYDNFCKTGNDVIYDVIFWFKMEIAKKNGSREFWYWCGLQYNQKCNQKSGQSDQNCMDEIVF